MVGFCVNWAILGKFWCQNAKNPVLFVTKVQIRRQNEQKSDPFRSQILQNRGQKQNKTKPKLAHYAKSDTKKQKIANFNRQKQRQSKTR